MKRVVSLLIVFFIIFSMMAPSMVMANVHNEGASEVVDDTVVSTESEEKISNADFREDFFVSYHEGYTLLKSGRLKRFLDKDRIISEKIPVESSIYYFRNLSAKYGNCFYVIYDSNDEVISYKKTDFLSKGEVIENIRVIMPKNASYFRIACDLKVNDKMFEATKINANPNGKIAQPTIISFTDDDCKIQVYEKLYPVIKELNLPYTLACPPDKLDDGNPEYMTIEQLKEMYNNGVDIVSHHLTEGRMINFKSIEAYEEDTKATLERFENMGIEISGVAYPNGAIKEEYMPIVKEYYKYGLTVDRGINSLPYESCYIDRCEVFPKSGIYNVEDAKALVDSVYENGGWLVFMTHCWYGTFSSDDLKELVNYIRSKNIEILNVKDVIENYGNPIDIGIVKKPLEDMSEDFYILDSLGRVYTNNIELNNVESKDITVVEKSSIKWEEVSIDYNIAATLKPNGKENSTFEKQDILTEQQILQRKRNTSIRIDVVPNSIYKLINMSAKYGKCFYVIYDSNDNVISYQSTTDESTGEILDEIIIKMPSNAAYFKMACDLNINDKMFKAYRASADCDEELLWEELNKGLLLEEIDITYLHGYTLLKSARIKTFSDQNRIITKEIPVESNSIYYFENLSAKYENCLGVIYNSNDEIISYIGTTVGSTGEVIENIRIIMPENAAYFRLACDLNVNDKMCKAYRVNISGDMEVIND